MNKENWIDVLKGMAICMIIMTHCGLYELPGKIGRLFTFGRCSELFFMLSSYMSFMSYNRFFKGDAKVNGVKWIFRKLLRLLPLYYLAIVFSLIFGGNAYWLGSFGKVSVWNVLAHLTLTHGFFPHYSNSIIGVEWYLGVLVIFYLFVPLLYKYVNSFEKTCFFLIVLVLVISIINPCLIKMCPIHDSYIYVNVINRFSIWAQMPVLLLGLCFYHLRPFVKKEAEKRKGYRWLSISLLLISAILLCGQTLAKNHLYRITDVTLTGLCFFILMTGVSELKNPDRGLFQFFGMYCYGLFLFHYPVMHCVDLFYPKAENAFGMVVRFVLVFVCTLMLTIVLTKYVDKPIQRVVKKASLSIK